MTYDPKCYELAEAFLEDEPALNLEANKKELAGDIQAAIENWLERARGDLEPPDPPGWEAGFAKNH